MITRELQWLIIGGGLHGVHMAARLIGEAGIEPSELGILDPSEQLLARWRATTAITGMTHLRSPSVHHIDQDPWSLRRFAGKPRHRPPGLFAAPYSRPQLQLFDDHCNYVIETHGLSPLHIQDKATGLKVDCDGIDVLTSSGVLRAFNLVLALGSSEQPHWPVWAPEDDPRVRHIFAQGTQLPPPRSGARCLVVGGGISAAQVALRLHAEGQHVHLVSRHALREEQFDSDPGWLGPKYMTAYAREPDLGRRRAIISTARHRGSLPPDVRRKIRRAIRDGELRWSEAEVLDLANAQGQRIVRLTSGEHLRADWVFLATGFASNRPGGPMIDRLIEEAHLPCAACGYPVVDHALRWHPRIHVMGPLAELELGPTSRNIAGARQAGTRIVEFARAHSA